MATYAQLQAEPYWSREIVTPEMDWLGDELCRRTRRPRVAFGTKGDNHHLRGAHRSQEWIRRSRWCTNRTYTVQSGLTAEQERHVAGADFTPGSAAEMVAQSKRLYAAMRAGLLDEVLEFYGNVDGDKVVDGWDNLRDRAATSDSSHLWHWHLTIDRRHCRNQQLMARILAIALGDTVEDEMTKDEVRAAVLEALQTPLPLPGKIRERMVAAGWAPAMEPWTALARVLETSLADQPAENIDEQAIVTGILAGLGSRPAGDVAVALVAAGQDPALLAAALTRLAAGQGQARG